MHLEAQDEITEILRDAEEPLTFDEIKGSTELRSQDARRGLRELIHGESGVYVYGVEDKEKIYDIK